MGQQKIVVLMKNGTKIELDKNIDICRAQISYLDKFFMSSFSNKGKMEFDYIKFVDEFIIAKEV